MSPFAGARWGTAPGTANFAKLMTAVCVCVSRGCLAFPPASLLERFVFMPLGKETLLGMPFQQSLSSLKEKKKKKN